jgi:hypothetical protein
MTLSRVLKSSSVAALMLVLSCGGDDPPTGNDSGFSGEYVLQSVNGNALPALELIDGWTGDSLIATSGKIRVLSHGRLQVIHESEWHSRVSGVEVNPTDTVQTAYTTDGELVLMDFTLFPPHTDTLVVTGPTVFLTTLFDSPYAAIHRRVDIYQRP